MSFPVEFQKNKEFFELRIKKKPERYFIEKYIYNFILDTLEIKYENKIYYKNIRFYFFLNNFNLSKESISFFENTFLNFLNNNDLKVTFFKNRKSFFKETNFTPSDKTSLYSINVFSDVIVENVPRRLKKKTEPPLPKGFNKKLNLLIKNTENLEPKDQQNIYRKFIYRINDESIKE